MNITVNGKHIQVEGEYYAGFISRDRLEPNEPEEYVINNIRLLEDFDEMTADYFNNSLEYDDQINFLGVDEYEISNICLELHEEMKGQQMIDEFELRRLDCY
jgi:hypothetical protein